VLDKRKDEARQCFLWLDLVSFVSLSILILLFGCQVGSLVFNKPWLGSFPEQVEKSNERKIAKPRK